MAKPKKDGHYINCYLDRTLYNRLCVYADNKGQTKTMAIERILKERFDEEKIPEKIDNSEKVKE